MPESALVKRRMERKPTAQELVKLSESLADLDWRLLHWLLRYPLQRADDLAVGVARWASRATVYRHVQELVEHELVESVLPKTPGTGKRLYSLSNSGLHLLARYLERPSRELARSFRADEAGLLRLLPRLPTLLLLQEVVNGLVTHAAETMTTQGRGPRLVRWTWQRDVAHRFHYREQATHLFADGAVALCIRIQQEDGSALDRWYGLFVLCMDLDDERLMRQRLEQLLRWRECPERWPVYQFMPPVLILARSPRQREHWQRAVALSSLKLRLQPLAGGLACLPDPAGEQVNPWLLSWRTLSTDAPCHLQDLLRPLPRAAFPLSLQLEEGDEEEWRTRSSSNASVPVVSCKPAARPLRLIAGNLAHRAARITRDEREEPEAIALLGLRLTPRQWSILRCLLVHPLLSDEELAAWLHLTRKSARCSLYELHALGCLDPLSTTVGKRWRLSGRGMLQIAAANHVHIRSFALPPDNQADPETPAMVQRGEHWLLRHIEHTAGVYRFFAALEQAARRERAHALCWWETGAMCERRYRVGEQWYNLRPDALAEYRVGPRRMRFWLEWDRGTMNARDLTVKFSAYAHYLASREWAREQGPLPRLFCVAPDIAQERRMQRVAQAQLTQVFAVGLCTTTEVLLNGYGPLGPIWRACLPQPGQVAQPSGSPRRCLSGIIAG